MIRRFLPIFATLCAATVAAQAIPVQKLLEASAVKGGLIVHLGCGDARSTIKFRASDRYLVHGLDTDPEKVARARRSLLEAGVYGPVSVDQCDGRHLPYVDNSVNLIVAEGEVARSLDLKEADRALAPLGVILIEGPASRTIPAGLVLDADASPQLPGWTILRKGYPEEMGEWTHFLHGPDNNAVGRDTLAEQPRSIQWNAGPRWGRSHEELASTSIGVSDNGRVFFIVDEAPLASIRFTGRWRLVARDAFNGKLLWKKPIPNWIDHLRHFRSGPVHLQRRLAAVDGIVYVTLGLAEPVTALDAATGEVLHTYAGTEHAEEIIVQDDILYLVVGTGEAVRKGEGLHMRNEPDPTPFRFVAAVDAKSEAMLWKHDFADSDYLLPLSLTVRGDNVFCQSVNGMVRLDAASGDVIWETPRSTPANRMAFAAPTVVATDEVLLAADREAKEAAKGPVSFGVHGWNIAGFSRKAKCVMNAYSVDNGKLLWSAPCAENYNSPVDIFVIDDIVYLGKDFKGYQLKTGEELRKLNWAGPAVAMAHPRCHRYKATVKNLFTGRSGIEVASFEHGWTGNNSWIRGTCQFGIMPANGLLYKAPDACGCYPKTKVQGFFAAASRRDDHRHQIDTIADDRLVKGPAYAPAPKSEFQIPQDSWPVYRGDSARSGKTGSPVRKAPELKWTTKLGGALTQAVSDGRMIYVAGTDSHSIHSLSAANGDLAWTYTAGGAIDSAPTLHGDMLFFGSADGWLYALRAADGVLAWRFRAAPLDRRVLDFDQLKSVWPVHGSVLVQNGLLHVACGRSSYLDDGIALYKLDPRSGSVLAANVVRTIDPDSNQPTVTEPSRGFDMAGTTMDLLSGDGELIFMKHLAFDADCQPTETRPHLFCPGGLLGEEWFVRNYWIHGTEMAAGWGGWAKAATTNASGRILSFDDGRVYGYGREGLKGGATGHKADNYVLFASAKAAAQAPAKAPAKGRKKRPGLSASKPETFWSSEIPFAVRAMVLTPDSIVIAGPPDSGVKSPEVLAYENEEEALAAFTGMRKARLAVISTADGSKLSEIELDAVPVFDGMSAAGGSLYLSLKNGCLQCWK